MSTPQATPKHLTDEELRQQYGIQLASRPQEGGDGNEAKWADIDDDEDDWAPETIEWNDGTKINLAQVDNVGVGEPQLATTNEKRADELAEHEKPKTPTTKPTTVGPNATVLKLGSALQPKSTGLVLKNSSEKPTLVAKPTTSTPVKSPWAAIPPVDKVSPVPINPPVQQPQPQLQPRFGQKDPHGFDAMPPPPAPHAKEIAADDFSRLTRDSPSTVPRELYNSQSGRLEQVSETRRQSAKKDQNFRQPSVLQRPPQGDQHGPAEPSPAFQTHRSQQEPGQFGRRRTSSTLSGESGHFGRRVSFNRGFEGARAGGDNTRRNSQHDQQPSTPNLPYAKPGQRDASPAISQGQSAKSQSPTVAPTQIASSNRPQGQGPANDTPAPLATTEEDPVVVQKRLMREKREAAIKRRREQDEREEAEKKERIRLKMERMGLTDEKMPNSKKAVTADTVLSPKVVLKDSKEIAPMTPQSPPKPPIPNVSGQPQQYGLMKVHAPQTVSVMPSSNLAMEKRSNELPQTVEAKLSSHAEDSTPQVNGETKKPSPEADKSPAPEVSHKETVAEARPQPWSSVQPSQGVHPAWNNNSMANHPLPAGILWGPPSNHRALGNGDFHNNISRPSVRQSQQAYSQHSQQMVPTPQPPPIGTPRQSQQLRTGPSPDKPFDPTSRSTAEDSQTIPAFPPETFVPPGNYSRPQLPNLMPSLEPHQPPVPIPTSNTMPPSTVDRPAAINAWASFGKNAAKLDAERHNRLAQEHAVLQAEQKLAGIQPTEYPALKETWKQVKRGDETGSRKVVTTTQTEREYLEPSEITKPPTQASAAPHVRSRYQDIFDQNQHVASAPPLELHPGSPTGPPPESSDHPAYNSASQRPLVNLPGSKPKVDLPEKPVVRLPPANSPRAAPQASKALDSRLVASPVRAAAQPLVSNPTWQDRFNGLFDRKSSPEKKTLIDVTDFSTSKVPLELTSVGHSTPVTLPPQDEPQMAATEPLLKNVEDEDALFEERDFGSVPTTRIPSMAPAAAWNPAREPHFPTRRLKATLLRDPDVTSGSVFVPGYEETIRPNDIPITVLLQGMANPKVKMMPQPTGFVAPRSGHHHSKGKSRHGHKNRDSASPHGSAGSNANNANSRAVSSPAPGMSRPRPKHHNNASWARRVSGVA